MASLDEPRVLPSRADDLTAEWVSAALASETGDAQVVQLTAEAIGTGQLAETRRLGLAWEPPEAGPATIVAKVPSEDPQSLSAARVMRNYAIEVTFYRDVAPTVDVFAPTCHFADHDPETEAFALLLDDLAPARQGDQLTGCTVDEAAAAVDELVALHAPRWNDDGVLDHDLSWMNLGGAAGAAFAQMVPPLFTEFLSRYGDRLEPEVTALVERLSTRLVPYLGERVGPRAVTHNDFRLDNLLFGGARVGVVDWQTVSYGYALADLSYFVGGSLFPTERAQHERDLVRRYVEGLHARGIDLDWDDCWEGFRRYALDGLLMAVMASIGVVRTERGDDMFMAMAERGAQHALDLESESLIP